MPAIVSQIPLRAKVIANGLRLFLSMYLSPSIGDSARVQLRYGVQLSNVGSNRCYAPMSACPLKDRLI